MSKCFGVTPANKSQVEALEALTNPEVDLVILDAEAGSGKTLLAIAAGLQSVLDYRKHSGIIYTRAVCGVGKDIGFIPGTESEKMLPWAYGLLDNLEVLFPSNTGKFSREVLEDVLKDKIKILSMLYMRGRSFQSRWVIVDECSNLTIAQLKVLITRVGSGTKLILMGDRSQIDNPSLNEDNNGLSQLIEYYQYAPVDYVKYVKLEGCERSRLCAWGIGI